MELFNECNTLQITENDLLAMLTFFIVLAYGDEFCRVFLANKQGKKSRNNCAIYFNKRQKFEQNYRHSGAVQAHLLHCQLHLPAMFNCETLSLICIYNKFRRN
jgi:hypothetical protein